MADVEYNRRLLALKDRIADHFDANNWLEVGLLTGHTGIIQGHARLLRSLSFGDEDYPGNCLAVIMSISNIDPTAIAVIEQYVDRAYPAAGTFISAKDAGRRITFAPNVFASTRNL